MIGAALTATIANETVPTHSSLGEEPSIYRVSTMRSMKPCLRHGSYERYSSWARGRQADPRRIPFLAVAEPQLCDSQKRERFSEGKRHGYVVNLPNCEADRC